MPRPVHKPAIDISKILVLVAALAFMVLNILRIIYVPVTHDEGLTYNWYITTAWRHIISIHPNSANDHILNSLLSKFFMLLFGNGQFWLRFASLLSLPVYMFFSFRILSSILTDKVLILAAFLLLLLDPFMFEFWGLCRGYSLSLACMMAGIYYLLQYIKQDNSKLLWYSMAWAMAAVYSNYTLLYFFMALLAVSAMVVFYKGSRGRALLKDLSPVFICAVVLFLTVVGNIMALSNDHQLYYGGDKGLLPDTIVSLLRESLYLGNTQQAPLMIAARAILALSACTGVYYLIGLLRRRAAGPALSGPALYLLLLLPVLAISLQHLLTGSLYVIERTALFLLPLFLLQLVPAIAAMPKLVARTLLLVLTSLAAVNFCLHLNFNTTRSWPDDAPVLLVMEKMMREHTGPDKIKVRAEWRLQPAMQYYIATQYSARFAPVAYIKVPMSPDTAFDYFYVHHDNLDLTPPNYATDTIVNRNRYLLLRKLPRPAALH